MIRSPILSNFLQIGKNFSEIGNKTSFSPPKTVQSFPISSKLERISYFRKEQIYPNMIEHPPLLQRQEIIAAALEPTTDEVKRLVDRLVNDYTYWTDIKYRAKNVALAPERLWAHLKAERERKAVEAWPNFGIHFTLTSEMQRVCHETDLKFGGQWGSQFQPDKAARQKYLVCSIFEEAISSSQLEGASTTRRDALRMLCNGEKPKDKGRLMIFNNYRTIRFLVEHKNEDLTPDLLMHIHALMTDQTLDKPEDAGRMRENNEVVVENVITNEVVHRPPHYELLPQFVEDLCRYFNNDSPTPFLHPLLRGIVIHFMVAYMHPFVDGNGRTARALFYWFMLRHDYWLMEYVSISAVIKKNKIAYERAYLQSEADGLDIGYFVNYHLRTLMRAFKELEDTLTRSKEEKKRAHDYMKIDGIQPRQAKILQLMQATPDDFFTVKNIQLHTGVTPTTAKSDLVRLMELGLVEEIPLNKVKRGYVLSRNFEEQLHKLRQHE